MFRTLYVGFQNAAARGSLLGPLGGHLGESKKRIRAKRTVRSQCASYCVAAELFPPVASAMPALPAYGEMVLIPGYLGRSRAAAFGVEVERVSERFTGAT